MDDDKSNEALDYYVKKLHQINNDSIEELDKLKIYIDNYIIIKNIRTRLRYMEINLHRHKKNINQLETELDKSPLNNHFINNFIVKYTKKLRSKTYCYKINISEQSLEYNRELKFETLDNDIYIKIRGYFISNIVTNTSHMNEDLQFDFDPYHYSLKNDFKRHENGRIIPIVEIESSINASINETQEISYKLVELENQNNNLINQIKYNLLTINENYTLRAKEKAFKILETLDKQLPTENNNDLFFKNDIRIQKEKTETLSNKILAYKDAMNTILAKKNKEYS